MADHTDKGFIQQVTRGQKNFNPLTKEPISLKTSLSQEAEPRSGLGTLTVSEIMQGMGSYKPDAVTWDAFNQSMSGDLGHFIDSEGGVNGTLKTRAPLLAQDIANGKRGFDDGTFTKASGIEGIVNQGLSEVTSGVPSGTTSTSTAEGVSGGIQTNVGGLQMSAQGPGTKIYNPPQGKKWTKGQQSYKQVADLALTVGLDRNLAVLFTAIAFRESRHISNAHNPNANTGDNSYGLWQINVIDRAMSPGNLEHWRQFDLTDPYTNAMAMKFLLDNGGSPEQNWYTNRDGSGAHAGYGVTDYMPQAREAVNSL